MKYSKIKFPLIIINLIFIFSLITGIVYLLSVYSHNIRISYGLDITTSGEIQIYKQYSIPYALNSYTVSHYDYFDENMNLIKSNSESSWDDINILNLSHIYLKNYKIDRSSQNIYWGRWYFLNQIEVSDSIKFYYFKKEGVFDKFENNNFAGHYGKNGFNNDLNKVIPFIFYDNIYIAKDAKGYCYDTRNIYSYNLTSDGLDIKPLIELDTQYLVGMCYKKKLDDKGTQNEIYKFAVNKNPVLELYDTAGILTEAIDISLLSDTEYSLSFAQYTDTDFIFVQNNYSVFQYNIYHYNTKDKQMNFSKNIQLPPFENNARIFYQYFKLMNYQIGAQLINRFFYNSPLFKINCCDEYRINDIVKQIITVLAGIVFFMIYYFTIMRKKKFSKTQIAGWLIGFIFFPYLFVIVFAIMNIRKRKDYIKSKNDYSEILIVKSE